jgi:hypothetical protein
METCVLVYGDFTIYLDYSYDAYMGPLIMSIWTYIMSSENVIISKETFNMTRDTFTMYTEYFIISRESIAISRETCTMSREIIVAAIVGIITTHYFIRLLINGTITRCCAYRTLHI